jgi:hypothetical protein
MMCDICKNVDGKTYIAFPEEEHLTEEIEVLSLCRKCKPSWYKILSSELRLKYHRWVLRSTGLKMRLEPITLTKEQQDIIDVGVKKIDFPVYRAVGYIPDEEDLVI